MGKVTARGKKNLVVTIGLCILPCIKHEGDGRPEDGHTKVSCGVSIKTVSTCLCPMLLLGVCAGLMGEGGMTPPLPPLKFCKEVNLKICSGSGRSPVAQRA